LVECTFAHFSSKSLCSCFEILHTSTSIARLHNADFVGSFSTSGDGTSFQPC
jgi:hypothetical protein